MEKNLKQDQYVEDVWRTYMEKGDYAGERRQRQVFKLLPGNPRCKNCLAPFRGLGGSVVRMLYGKRPSNMNPRLCNACEEFSQKYQGGAEIELTLLFVDVRGSTALAEKMRPREFSTLINRFYTTASRILVDTDALIDKIIGDQVAGIYTPGIAGQEHARKAIDAAMQIMRETGHERTEGPWLPLGAGVHTGLTFIGSVGTTDSTHDITVLGDAANTAARLSSQAKVGEILISDDAYRIARMNGEVTAERQVELKGKTQTVSVHALTDYRKRF
jgi:adenylate cyclase